MLKDDLEAKTGLDIEMRHPIIPWLVEWTDVTLNRHLVYKSGRTAFHNVTGKNSDQTCRDRVTSELEKDDEGRERD